MERPHEYVTGDLLLGDPEWSAQQGFPDVRECLTVFRERWPKDACVYVIGTVFGSGFPLPEAEKFLGTLPGRKVYVFDHMNPERAAVASLGGWHETMTQPKAMDTWGIPVALALCPQPERLTFHVDDSCPDTDKQVNVSWHKWCGEDPANAQEWSGFMPPYYLSLYASSTADGSVLPL